MSQLFIQQSSVKEVVLISAMSGTTQKVKAIYLYTLVNIIQDIQRQNVLIGKLRMFSDN